MMLRRWILNSSLFIPRAIDGQNIYSNNIYLNVNTGNDYEKDIVTTLIRLIGKLKWNTFCK